ncbi:pentapeptide repeat-containing protein [Streptomyces sp. NPDC014802]|uniref:pentapeptide repeat-containing protein n=1 Tax=Streptomyces sp. NPDC014802 TaxID=3364917 RepID=UPI0036F6BB69
MRRCLLRGSNLRQANLREAELDGTDLRGARLDGTDLTGGVSLGLIYVALKSRTPCSRTAHSPRLV